jgi:DNA-cytosine methyltransferase
MKVLSLFDGMSCGQIALSKLGVKVDKYYASEIDKYAIQITQKNFPDTVQLGDICEIDAKDFMDVDLILAGSPCQGFSFAGKQLAFDDPRSALFFEFVRLLKEIRPKYFLLENVRMKKEFLEVITEQVSACYTADDVAPEYKDIFGSVKLEPHFINSSLLSAQSRQRYYWTNIPNIQQPEDKGIVLRDVLEYNPQDPTLMSDNFVARQIKNEKDGCLITEGKEKASNLSAEEYVKNGRQGDYLACDDDGKPIADMVGQNGKKLIKENLDKAMTITARDYKGFSGRGSTGVRVDSPKRIGTADNIKGHDILKRVYSEDGKSPTITAHAAQGSVPKIETKPKQVGVAVDIKGHDILKRVYSPEGKSPTINAHSGGNTEPKVVTGGAMRARSKNKDGKHVEWKETKPQQMLELRKDEKSNSISTVSKDSLVVQSYREVRTDEAKKARKEARQKTGKDHTPFRSKKLEPRDDGKVGTVTPSLNKDHEISMIREKSKTVRSGGRGSYDRHEWDSVDEMHWRKLTPLECERLQTVPDGYTEGVSNTQRYRMLGNGWTVDVIAHILTNMEK